MRYFNLSMLLISILLGTSSITKNDITLTGTVTESELGEAVIGALVQIKEDPNIGTVTDISGEFELKVNQLPVTLIVSYIGYTPQEVYIDKNERIKNIKISLVASTNMLDEVVVTGMSRKREKKALGQSPITIRGTSINGHPGSVGYIRNRAYHPRTHYPENESESYGQFTENAFIRPMDEPLSTFSIDVDRASYSNVRRFLKSGQLPPPDAVRIEEMINYFNYDFTTPKNNTPIAINTTLTQSPWNKNHELLHLSIQGKQIENKNIPKSNFVFLIDVSGSMSSDNKLPLVKSSMALLLNQLRPDDKVAIVTYAGRAGIALASTEAKNKIAILDAIDDLGAGGSTAGAQGILTAYKIARRNFIEGGNNRVILATDGDFNVGPNSNEELEKLISKEKSSGVSLSILAYGRGNYQDDLMQSLAQAGNGNHSYIDDLQEAQKTLINEFSSTLFMIAKDVKVQIEFNPAKVEAYRLIGYESRLLNKEDFNNDKKDAGDMGSGHSVTAIYEIVPAGIENEYVGSVDELKYQKSQKPVFSESKEIGTVKFRFKSLNDSKSQKITKVIKEKIGFDQASNNVHFSTAVAAFGMKLKDSDYSSDYTFEEIINLAKSSRGIDEEGYRAEFIRLIKSAKALRETQQLH